MSLKRKEVIETSKVKARVSAVVAPMVIFSVMYFIQRDMALVVVGIWYTFATLVYMIDRKKELTAMYYFQYIKIVMLFLSPVIALAGLGILISKYF